MFVDFFEGDYVDFDFQVCFCCGFDFVYDFFKIVLVGDCFEFVGVKCVDGYVDVMYFVFIKFVGELCELRVVGGQGEFFQCVVVKVMFQVVDQVYDVFVYQWFFVG